MHDPYFENLFHRCQLRDLHQVECYLTPSSQLIKFLNRHPALDYLQLSPHEDTNLPLFALDGVGKYTDDIQLLELPALKHFVGNVQWIPYLGLSSRLKAVIINWNAVDTNVELAFQALHRSSQQSLALLCCVRRSWNLDMLQSISVWLPDIQYLHISNIMLVDAFPTEVN